MGKTNFLYPNVKYLAKIKGIPLVNIEEPHQPGYLSRNEKKNNCWSLPIAYVYDLSKYLGFTIEDLIEKDLSKVSELEKIRRDIQMLKEREKELIRACEVI